MFRPLEKWWAFRPLKNWWHFRPWRRHSTVLLVAGLTYIAIGVSYQVADVPPARAKALKLALAWLPIKGWGVCFIAVGVMSILSCRWPQFVEKWGYMVLTGFSAGWSSFYAMGIVFENAPISNVSTVLLWGLVAFLWWAISGLHNPERRKVVMYDAERHGSSG